MFSVDSHVNLLLTLQVHGRLSGLRTILIVERSVFVALALTMHIVCEFSESYSQPYRNYLLPSGICNRTGISIRAILHPSIGTLQRWLEYSVQTLSFRVL